MQSRSVQVAGSLRQQVLLLLTIFCGKKPRVVLHWYRKLRPCAGQAARKALLSCRIAAGEVCATAQRGLFDWAATAVRARLTPYGIMRSSLHASFIWLTDSGGGLM